MEEIFYHKGMTFDRKIINKIKRDCKLCSWCNLNSIDKDFIGYKKGDKVYDLCHYLIWKQREKNQEQEKDYVNKFNEIKDTVLDTINLINLFINSLTDISDIKGNLRSLNKKLENGYVNQDAVKIRGKKKRRYKKDSKRYLTNPEIIHIKDEISNLELLETSLSKKLIFEELLVNIIKNMENIDNNLMKKYNNRFEWFETCGLYKDYTDILHKLNLKINHFTYNNMKEKYDLQNKVFDLKLEEINIFEETYQKVLDKIEEEKEIQDTMTVKNKRNVTKKAKFYLDENGNRVELDQKLDQIVIHN